MQGNCKILHLNPRFEKQSITSRHSIIPEKWKEDLFAKQPKCLADFPPTSSCASISLQMQFSKYIFTFLLQQIRKTSHEWFYLKRYAMWTRLPKVVVESNPSGEIANAQQHIRVNKVPGLGKPLIHLHFIKHILLFKTETNPHGFALLKFHHPPNWIPWALNPNIQF